MTITNEMIEAACVAYAGGTLEYLGPTATARLRRDMARALEAAEALRPKMVEVTTIAAPGWGEFPAGTKLYAEQPE